MLLSLALLTYFIITCTPQQNNYTFKHVSHSCHARLVPRDVSSLKDVVTEQIPQASIAIQATKHCKVNSKSFDASKTANYLIVDASIKTTIHNKLMMDQKVFLKLHLKLIKQGALILSFP